MTLKCVVLQKFFCVHLTFPCEISCYCLCQQLGNFTEVALSVSCPLCELSKYYFFTSHASNWANAESLSAAEGKHSKSCSLFSEGQRSHRRPGKGWQQDSGPLQQDISTLCCRASRPLSKPLLFQFLQIFPQVKNFTRVSVAWCCWLQSC